MIFHLKSCIRTFFAAIARAFGMSSNSLNPQYFEFRSRIDITNYLDILELAYGQEDLERMNAMHVTKVVLRKQLDKKSEHEYLVAYIQTPAGTTKYLAIERLRGAENLSSHGEVVPTSQSDTALACVGCPDDILPTPSTPSRKKHHASGSSSSSISSLDSLSKKSPRHANDVVQVLDNPYHKEADKEFTQLEFTTNRPLYLYQLAILAETLHKSEICYKLFSKNCYWFAGLLLDVLETDYDLGKCKKSGCQQSGTCNYIPVFTEVPKTFVNDIIRERNERVGAFEQKVSFRLAILTCILSVLLGRE
jgi:hypothetical protein